MENKQEICNALLETLKLTNASVTKLVYYQTADGEFVRIQYDEKGFSTNRVNVTADSGTAMIRDIMKKV